MRLNNLLSVPLSILIIQLWSIICSGATVPSLQTGPERGMAITSNTAPDVNDKSICGDKCQRNFSALDVRLVAQRNKLSPPRLGISP